MTTLSITSTERPVRLTLSTRNQSIEEIAQAIELAHQFFGPSLDILSVGDRLVLHVADSGRVDEFLRVVRGDE